MSLSRPGRGVADMVKRNAHVHGRRRMRRSADGWCLHAASRESPAGSNFNDFMFTTITTADAESLPRAGVERHRATSRRPRRCRQFDDIRRWLDFGCGYGR